MSVVTGRPVPWALLLSLAGWLAAGAVAQDAGPANLLTNPDFEAGEAGWQRRTPDGAARTLAVVPEAARSGGFGARITNHQETSSRWRQGAGRELPIAPGALVRLSGWLRTDLGPGGYAALRLYAMSADDEITGQPTSRGVTDRTDWTRVSVNLAVPAGTAYLMPYLELFNAQGTADFDDLRLEIVGQAPRRQVTVDTLLLSDAADDDPMVQSLTTLYPGQLAHLRPGEAVDWAAYRRAIVFGRGDEFAPDVAALEAFVARGGRAVVDLAVYAAARGLTVETALVEPAAARLVIAEAEPVTQGFQPGDAIPWFQGTAAAPVQRSLWGAVPGVVLGHSPGGAPLLVRETVGEGTLLATDLTGLAEPVWREPGNVNKYLFAGNLLGGSVRYGRHFERKLTYAGFVTQLHEFAAQHPAVQLRDEGPADEDYRLYSLQMGEPDKPAILVYAAAHGSEWEPAYGLFALVERLVQHPDEGLFDFDRNQLVVMPIVNAWGYDHRKRHNSRGVDTNRNGAHRWAEYQGRENADGVYGPGSYDFKGSAPFSEPATQTWRAMVDRVRPEAVLDFHGNSGGRGNNRLIILPATAREANADLAADAVHRFNEAIADRYVLLESNRPAVEQYEIESIQWGAQRPTITSYACQDALGFTCEVPAGYADTYASVFQTDVVIETAVAFFGAYQGS